jgi:hypothetical protein
MIYGFIAKNSKFPEKAETSVVSQGPSSPDPKPQPSIAAPAKRLDDDPINGVATGDSNVPVVYKNLNEPDMGKFTRDNQKLEKLGYIMGSSTFRIVQGSSVSTICAVYNKKK